jgi:hypothetical protein
MDNSGGKIAERMMDTRLQIGRLNQDILENHSKPNLEQRKLTWIHDKSRLESITASWFRSNGYLPNSSQQKSRVGQNAGRLRHRTRVQTPSALWATPWCASGQRLPKSYNRSNPES